MTARLLASHSLTCHPTTPCAAVRGIDVEVWQADGVAQWRYTLRGELDRIRWPAPAATPSPQDLLWQHTCFEAFIGQGADRSYHEFNFSPSGNWADYAFADERVRATDAATHPVRIQCAREGDVFTLTADAPSSVLDGASLIGLTAVIENTDGALSYWALHHPTDKPDFHHRSGWTLRLPALKIDTKDSPA